MATGDKITDGLHVYIETPLGRYEKFYEGESTGGTGASGTTFYDIPNDYMYVVFGEDGEWYAIRYRNEDQKTIVFETDKPTTLAELITLEYS